MSEKVLITGASGFLGYHLITEALRAGFEVVAAVRKSSKIEHLKDFEIQYCEPDFNNIDSLAKTIDSLNIKNIVHAAGTTKAIRQQDYNYSNATITSNLAKAAEKTDAFKKFIFISSLAVNGPLDNNDFLITEENLPNPVTAYGRSKSLAEQALMKTKIPFTIFRPTAIYGPRDKDIFIMINTLNKGWDPYIGRMDQKLSFIHGSDVASISIQTLMNPNSDKLYLLTDGKNYNRYEFADIAKNILNKKAFRIHLPLSIVKALSFFIENSSRLMNKAAVLNYEKLNELTGKNWGCDITKAKIQLGFEPKYDLTSGLKNTIEWYLNNGWIK